jgi:hypothetical protein
VGVQGKRLYCVPYLRHAAEDVGSCHFARRPRRSPTRLVRVGLLSYAILSQRLTVSIASYYRRQP